MDIDNYRYVGEDKFKISKFKTNDKGGFNSREDAVEEFVSNLNEINRLQQKLYAERKEGVVFIFQAMDAAGKDGVIRTVFSTLTPHGVKEYCFKVPSAEEAAHDYLCRFWPALPARGHITIFNRSYYEDVLIGKVHKLYENQDRPDRLKDVDVIKQRYKEIKDFEKYLYNNGTRVVKIFLNVSKDEQAKRFISRIDTPKKNWKISAGDIKEREYWDEYQDAFEKMINKTSTDYSPWYVVPADHKWFARLLVSRIVLETLKEIDPHFPRISAEEMEDIYAYRKSLVDSLEDKTGYEEAPDSVFSKTCELVMDNLNLLRSSSSNSEFVLYEVKERLMNSYIGDGTSSYNLLDCKNEMLFLSLFTVNRFSDLVSKLDSEKINYLLRLLDGNVDNIEDRFIALKYMTSNRNLSALADLLKDDTTSN